VILLFLFILKTVFRELKIYSARSWMNLGNVHKFTQETLARGSSFDRFNAPYYLCFHISIIILFLF